MGYILCVEKTGTEFVLPILSPELPINADKRTGSRGDFCVVIDWSSIG